MYKISKIFVKAMHISFEAEQEENIYYFSANYKDEFIYINYY